MKVYVYTRAVSSNDDWNDIVETRVFAGEMDALGHFRKVCDKIVDDIEDLWGEDWVTQQDGLCAHYTHHDSDAKRIIHSVVEREIEV